MYLIFQPFKNPMRLLIALQCALIISPFPLDDSNAVKEVALLAFLARTGSQAASLPIVSEGQLRVLGLSRFPGHLFEGGDLTRYLHSFPAQFSDLSPRRQAVLITVS